MRTAGRCGTNEKKVQQIEWWIWAAGHMLTFSHLRMVTKPEPSIYRRRCPAAPPAAKRSSCCSRAASGREHVAPPTLSVSVLVREILVAKFWVRFLCHNIAGNMMRLMLGCLIDKFHFLGGKPDLSQKNPGSQRIPRTIQKNANNTMDNIWINVVLHGATKYSTLSVQRSSAIPESNLKDLGK